MISESKIVIRLKDNKAGRVQKNNNWKVQEQGNWKSQDRGNNWRGRNFVQ